MASVRYIGSKVRLVGRLSEILGPPDDASGHFVDAFCGTGVVAAAAADLGWAVRANDHLLSSASLATAGLLSARDVPFEQLGGYSSAISSLNAAPPERGFFWREYGPASDAGRMYFTESNACRIDGARARISGWLDGGCLNRDEHLLLIADLIVASARVANTAGTYGCYLQHWTTAAERDLVFSPRRLRESPVSHEAFSRDVNDVPIAVNDVVYLDPPYTKRQYAAYYHINETLAHGDEPAITGKTGLRPWKEKASVFCYKARALHALVELISNISAQRVLLSYSNEGHVSLEDLTMRLAPLGELLVHEVGSIGRYRPNRTASATADVVAEYVLELQRTEVMEPSPEFAL